MIPVSEPLALRFESVRFECVRTDRAMSVPARPRAGPGASHVQTSLGWLPAAATRGAPSRSYPCP